MGAIYNIVGGHKVGFVISLGHSGFYKIKISFDKNLFKKLSKGKECFFDPSLDADQNFSCFLGKSTHPKAFILSSLSKISECVERLEGIDSFYPKIEEVEEYLSKSKD